MMADIDIFLFSPGDFTGDAGSPFFAIIFNSSFVVDGHDDGCRDDHGFRARSNDDDEVNKRRGTAKKR